MGRKSLALRSAMASAPCKVITMFFKYILSWKRYACGYCGIYIVLFTLFTVFQLGYRSSSNVRMSPRTRTLMEERKYGSENEARATFDSESPKEVQFGGIYEALLSGTDLKSDLSDVNAAYSSSSPNALQIEDALFSDDDGEFEDEFADFNPQGWEQGMLEAEGGSEGLYPSQGGNEGLYPPPGGSEGLYPAQGGSEGLYPPLGGSEGLYPAQGASEGLYPPPGGSEGLYPAQGGSEGLYPPLGGNEAIYPAQGNDLYGQQIQEEIISSDVNLPAPDNAFLIDGDSIRSPESDLQNPYPPPVAPGAPLSDNEGMAVGAIGAPLDGQFDMFKAPVDQVQGEVPALQSPPDIYQGILQPNQPETVFGVNAPPVQRPESMELSQQLAGPPGNHFAGAIQMSQGIQNVPQQFEYVETPMPPAVPAAPAFPDNPAGPAYPNNPTVPAYPNNPAVLAFPGNPAVPAFPDDLAVPAYPNNPTVPAYLNNPTVPPYPNNAAVPAYPNNAGVPAYPNNAAVPAYPNNAAVPAYPNNAAVPAYPNNAAVPAYPAVPPPPNGQVVGVYPNNNPILVNPQNPPTPGHAPVGYQALQQAQPLHQVQPVPAPTPAGGPALPAFKKAPSFYKILQSVQLHAGIESNVPAAAAAAPSAAAPPAEPPAEPPATYDYESFDADDNTTPGLSAINDTAHYEQFFMDEGLTDDYADHDHDDHQGAPLEGMAAVMAKVRARIMDTFPPELYLDKPYDEGAIDLKASAHGGPPLTPVDPVPQKVVYNRVGKCGSTTVKSLIKGLSLRNGYEFISSRLYRSKRLNQEEDQKRLIDDIMRMKPPAIFERHLYFLNFTKFGYNTPVHINIIRDPLDRKISSYYYRRNLELRKETILSEDTINNFNMTYDECVLGGHACVRPQMYFKIIQFFCGQEDFCGVPTRPALQRAKQNVAQFYAVVGLMEDMEGFFTVLEYMLPDFFKDARKIYIKKHKSLNSNKKKTPILEATRNKMMELLELEYEFYYWIKQRIEHQLKVAMQSLRQKYKGTPYH